MYITLFPLPSNCLEFQIGFSRTIIDVTEGVQVLVTIEQINDVIGERRPDNLMERPNVNNVNIPNDAQGMLQ